MWRLVLLLVLTLPACAADGGEEAPPGQSANPTSRPTPDVTADDSRSPASSASATDGDTITGVLGADSIEGGCAYLQTADGTRYEVIYPQGWEIEAEPLTLTNPDGEVVARGGETITVHGREATEMASICQIGPIFEAAEVVSVD